MITTPKTIASPLADDGATESAESVQLTLTDFTNNNQRGSDTARLAILDPGQSVWRTPFDRLDVDRDGKVIPLDALIVINELNDNGPHALASTPDPTKPFFDVDGNLWAAAGWGGDGYDGVHVVAPDGARIGFVKLPEACANLCFGGEKGNRLFMTASQSIYSLFVETRGGA